tara:strand:- start:340 stop:729 length:390 start_codon:yes stop_codon:yes gene_type:complete
MKTSQATIDKAAIGISLVCTAHCFVTPVAIALLPALSATVLEDELFHFALLFAVLPTSLLALGLGCRQHKRVTVFATGLIGLMVLSLAVILGHDGLGETGEKVTTVLGATIIAFAHTRNFTLCREQRCH